MRATNFSKQEIRCMYRGFKQVSSGMLNLKLKWMFLPKKFLFL